MHTAPTRSLLVASATALCLSTTVNATLIDDFDDGSVSIVASDAFGPILSSDSIATAAAIGGTRDITVADGTGPLGTTGTVGDGLLNFANSPISSGTLELAYSGLGAVDLTEGGTADSIAFTVDFSDAEVDYTIVINGGSTVSGTIAAGIAAPTEVLVAFADFSVPAEASSADSITITFDPTSDATAADLLVSNIESVPEPGSLALLGLGGLLLGRRRRV